MFLTETGCWMSPKSPGSKTTPSIRNIRTGGLPSWTTSRPPLSLTSPSCVAFSFRGGAKKESTGPSSSSFTGKGLMSIARHPTLWWTFRIEFSLCLLVAHRLQEISEEMRSRCPQRKRSSSLPVPKIEVSLCSANESKQQSKEQVPQSRQSDDYLDLSRQQHSGIVYAQYIKLGTTHWEGGLSTDDWTERFDGGSQGASPKDENSGINNTAGTKRRKMADLRAFVETRLLSRSDKMLEKIDFKNSAAQNNRTLLAAPDTVFISDFPLLFVYQKSRCCCRMRKSIRPSAALKRTRASSICLRGRCRLWPIPETTPPVLTSCRSRPLWSKARACRVSGKNISCCTFR